MLKYSNIRKEEKKKKISRDTHASCAYFLYQFSIPIFFRKTEYKLYIWYVCSWKFRWKRKDRKKKEYKNNSISWFVSYCLLPCTRFAHFAILLFTFPLLLFFPPPSLFFSFFAISTKLIDFQSASVITRVNDRTWRHWIRTPGSRTLWNCRFYWRVPLLSRVCKTDNRRPAGATAITR